MHDESNNEEKKILEGLKFAIGIQCEQCSHINSGDATCCEECGFEFPRQAEEKQFSYKQDDMAGGEIVAGDSTQSARNGLKAIPLEEARNLILLQETVEGAENGEIDPEEYRMNVSKVFNVAQIGVELFKTQVFNDTIAKLPDEQKSLAVESARLFDLYALGCQKMLEFDGGDLQPAYQGLEMVEKALFEMDRIQKRAIEIALEEREIKLQEN